MLNNTKNQDIKDNKNLYLNFGFSPNFFSEIKKEVYIIEKNPMRKISSANAVLELPIEEQINQKKFTKLKIKNYIINKKKKIGLILIMINSNYIIIKILIQIFQILLIIIIILIII